MNGRMYVVCRAFPETTQEGEKTVCLNAETGEIVWKERIGSDFAASPVAEEVRGEEEASPAAGAPSVAAGPPGVGDQR